MVYNRFVWILKRCWSKSLLFTKRFDSGSFTIIGRFYEFTFCLHVIFFFIRGKVSDESLKDSKGRDHYVRENYRWDSLSRKYQHRFVTISKKNPLMKMYKGN